VATKGIIDELPVLWVFTTGTQAVGLWIDRTRPDGAVWMGNDKGEIFALTRAGDRTRTLSVPSAVHALYVDDVWTYAACNDGNVYDLDALPKRAPVVQLGPGMHIGWIEAHRGRLCVADAEGGLTVFDVEKNILWEKRTDDADESWMVRAHDDGVYYGCELGLFAYDWSGAQRWHLGAHDDLGDVRFGDVLGDDLVVTAGWSKRKQTHLHVITRAGKRRFTVRLKPGPGGEKAMGAESCCAGRDAKGNTRFYGSCGGYLFCFDHNGKPLWRAPTTCGSACNMIAVDERLYIVTSNGTCACIDVSDAAIAAARKGVVPETKTNTSIPPKAAQ
jgi:outer membrane protein assembly factor BamB